MSVQSWVIATGLGHILKDIDRNGLITKLAGDLDGIMDDKLGSRSEGVQEDIITYVLLPLCRELMKEDVKKYVEILEEELLEARAIKPGASSGNVETRKHKPVRDE